MSDLVCSEVNSFSRKIQDDQDGFITSIFKFSPSITMINHESPILKRSRSNPIGLVDSDEEDIEVPCFSSLGHQDLETLEYDSDGDIDVPRHNDTPELEVRLQHKDKTVLGEVGLQVWRGSLLLSDYILHHQTQFSDKNVLEVGSGTGLASIIASYCGAK